MINERDLLAGLARPTVSPADAAEVARERWGLPGTVTELGSQQDRNFLLRHDDRRFVVKIANPAAARRELAAQSAALHALADAGVRGPVPVESLRGNDIEEITVGGVALLARMLTFVDGVPLLEGSSFGPPQARMLGDTAGRVVATLAGFRHEGTHRDTQWDLRAAGDVVATLLPFVPAERDRAEVGAVVEAARRRLAAVAELLPLQVIHADLTDDNLVVDEDGTAGVIDLGDLQHSWRVGELATTCAGVLANPGADRELVLETVRAFVAHVPLTDPELAALWPLIVLRTAVLVVSNAQQGVIDAGNDYAADRVRRERDAFRRAAAADADELPVLIAATAGFADTPVELGPLIPAGITPAVVDLSVTSPDLDGGRWLDAAAEHELLRGGHLLAGSRGAAVTRWAEYRLTRARPHAVRGTVPTFALGVDLSG